MTETPTPTTSMAPPPPAAAASSPVGAQLAPSSTGTSPVFIGRQSRPEVATVPSSPVTAASPTAAKVAASAVGRVSPAVTPVGQSGPSQQRPPPPAAAVAAATPAPSLGSSSLLAPISSSSFMMAVGDVARARSAQAAAQAKAAGRPMSSPSSPASDSRPKPAKPVGDLLRAIASPSSETSPAKVTRVETSLASQAPVPPVSEALHVAPTSVPVTPSLATPALAVKSPRDVLAEPLASPAASAAPKLQASLDPSPSAPTSGPVSSVEVPTLAAPASTPMPAVAPPISTSSVTTESSVAAPTPVSTPAEAEARKVSPPLEASGSVATAPNSSTSDASRAQDVSLPMRITLKVPLPEPTPPKKPKAAAPRRSVSIVPVRAEIYNLPSDDDEDMIECEPDPEDIKPIIPKRPEPAAPVAKATKASSKVDRQADEERERKRRKKEKLDEERDESRRKEARRKAKEEEKERQREKEREGKRAALAAWKKPVEAGPSKTTSSSKSLGSSKDARPAQSPSKPSSTASQPSKAPAQQSIFTKKPAPVALAPRKPPVETPLFLRATPGPSIDLTGDDSSPAPNAKPPASLKRPARVSSPIEEEPAAKRPATSGRQPASDKQTSQLSSSIFSFLDKGDVEPVVRDERPLDERREKAKDKAFITISDDEDESADEAPIRPKFYGDSSAHLSSPERPAAADTAMDIDEAPTPAGQPSRASLTDSRSREASVGPLPPSNMRTVVPVEVKTENDMPAIDAKVVTQMHKGRELSFKKGPDGFFNCTICRAYTKPHPILFKIHLVRCAAEFEDYPTDTSDSEAESDTSYVSAAKPSGKGKAVEMSDSDDAGSGFGLGSDDGSKREQAKKDKTAERAARKEKLAAKNATRKEKREAKKQRRDLKDKDGPKEKKPKIRKENRKIPSLARPSGGPPSSSGAGSARVKKQRPADSDDEVEHIDVKPLGGTKRQQPFARSAAVTLDQEHLVVDSDDSQSDEDDDTIVVLVRGSVVHVKPMPDGRYSCPACNNYKCKNPGYLKEHVLRCKRAVIVPGTNPTAPDPALMAASRARSPSVAAPPQLVRTKTVKNRNSPAPTTALPSFRKKTVAFTEQLYSTGPSNRAGPSRLADLSYQERVAAAFMSDGVHQAPPHMAHEDEYADNGFDAGRYSPPADQRFSPPPRTSAANLEPLSRSGAAYGFYSDAIRSEYDRRRASPSPPRSPPPSGLPDDGSQRSDHPSPGVLVHTLANLMHPIMPKPPPMALMQDIPLLLELLRKWQAVIISDARKGFENGVANAHEGQVLRRAWSSMMQASPVETRYSTWQDNAMRLWHLQSQLTDHVEKPSIFRDLVSCYFDFKNRPTLWDSGRSEQKHIAHLGMACHNLLRSVADAIKVYKGPNHLSGKWLENANISVATPVHLDLNHASWEDISRDMLDWAENILKCYQDLLDVEKKSREVADARAKAEIEHRARLAAYAQGHSAR